MVDCDPIVVWEAAAGDNLASIWLGKLAGRAAKHRG
jgi:hypothetical protein